MNGGLCIAQLHMASQSLRVISCNKCLSQDYALDVLHLVPKQPPDWRVIKYKECLSLECAHDVLVPKQQPCAFMRQHVSGYLQLSLSVLYLTKTMIIVAIFFNLGTDNFYFSVNVWSLHTPTANTAKNDTHTMS